MLREDTLIVKYSELGNNLSRRLFTLFAINALLYKPANFYTPTMLELSAEEWLYLREWISEGNGFQFWKLEAHGIHVIQACEKHFLVGTGQLLKDVRAVVKKPEPSSPYNKPHDVWLIVRHYIEKEIINKAEQHNGGRNRP